MDNLPSLAPAVLSLMPQQALPVWSAFPGTRSEPEADKLAWGWVYICRLPGERATATLDGENSLNASRPVRKYLHTRWFEAA